MSAISKNATKKTVVKNLFSRRWTLTVHGASPDFCPILAKLKAEFQKDEYTIAAVAYETGVHGIHPHWQIYFETESACRMKQKCEELLGQSTGFHLEAARGTLRANLRYVYAVEKEHQIGWVHYLKGTQPPNDYRSYKTQNLLWLRNNMKPWQAQITSLVTERADYRSIYWVHEPVGNTGKSYLAKYLHYFHGAIMTGGSVADMKHAISRWKQITGHFPVTIIFDVARSDRIKPAGYKGIEEIKNAIFFSGKYQSGMVASCNPPNIVIFANQAPRRGCMSSDRWVVYKICPDTNELVLDLPTKKK